MTRAGLDECICYAWAGDRRDTDVDEPDGANQNQLSVLFADLLSPGRYQLIYFNGEHGYNVFGVSEPFVITC